MLKRLAIAVAAFAAMGVAAQDYPTRTVTLIVPYAAGGPTDTVARVLAQAMTKPMGQTVVVENKPSAGGLVGAETVKNAKPDGYTLLIHHIGMATTPTLYRKALRFDPLKDFEYIGLINEVPMTIVGVAPRGFAGVAARDYLIATAVGIIPGTLVYTYFADALLSGVEGASRGAWIRVAAAGALLILLSFVPALVTSARRKRTS